ncbi:hypothetical protein HHJ69_01725 [Mobiluncus curtisii]|uniref:DUF6912 family protein n=1 Tax=Mobiluncus curtisii TaxID=2051 RepID=UPI0014702ABD|nr:hypothetical protein [Mobiluncus curtisii]MCV0019973.1 hypothetical protein [Mobiluncus curtisii]NMW46802.1 hypothetical protein [Mobiluncus curtisii]
MSSVPQQLKNIRAYIALSPACLQGKTWEGSPVTVVDEAWCVAAGFPAPGELRGEDREVAEDEALHAAALKSLDAQVDSPRPLRVVAVAEVAGTDLQSCPSKCGGSYILTRPVQYSEVASYHVDEPAAIAEVAKLAQLRARQAEGATEAGEPSPELEFPELLWFDGSELEILREFLGLS